MAKGIYVGGSVPKFTTTTKTVNIDTSNIESYFTVTNGSYYFVGSGSTFTTNNGGVGSSTAQTTLTALQDISNITFTYSYSSESGWDKFTLTVAGTTVENAVSGATTTKTYSGTLSAGGTIIFKYTKDGSVNSNDDKCTFSSMAITAQVKEPDGTTIDNVARKVIQPYVGVDNIARKVAHGYIGVDNVARRIFGDDIVYVTWNKYSCDVDTGEWVENLSSSYIGTTTTNQRSTAYTRFGADGNEQCQLRFWNNYYIQSGGNYNLSSSSILNANSSTTQEEVEPLAIGCYMTKDPDYTYTKELLYRVDSIDSFVNAFTAGSFDDCYISWTENLTCIGYMEFQSYATPIYSKGTTSYGTVTAPEGELPENGTLYKGSANGSYCVIYVSGEGYRYYEKQET